MSPMDRLRLFSAAQFEAFTYEWVHYALKPQYNEVNIIGGPGDKGRDVVAWKDIPGANPRRWDNYQCKHYDQPLAPGDFWVELGKLCYYTFTGEYCPPDNYYIISPMGLGPKLSGLLNKPNELRDGLIKNWDQHCKTNITGTSVIALTGPLLAHVNQFDFSHIKEVPPLEIIDQHRNTCPTHLRVFGGELKPRPQTLIPPNEIASKEVRYVEQLYAVYSEHTQSSVKEAKHFVSDRKINHHFNHSRKCFYSAESLKEFARDSLPGYDHFGDLAQEILDAVQTTLYDVHQDSYAKLNRVCETALSLQITSNILTARMNAADRTGICHHLANEDRIVWIDE